MAPIFWVGAGVMALLLDSSSSVGHLYSELATGILTMAFGIWAFWRNGGPRITGAGLYCLAISVYVGFAGIWWTKDGLVTDEVYIATIVGYWTTVGMYLLFWHRTVERQKLQLRSSMVTKWGMRIGFVVSIGGFCLGLVGVGNADQLALGGLAFLMVALILRRTEGEKIVKPAIVVGVVVLVFWLFVFSGAGRLNLVVLALVGVVVVSMRAERKQLKGLLLVVAPPVVILLGWIEMLGSAATSVGEGLASVVNPLKYFGALVVGHDYGLFEFGGGDMLLATALFWVPRSLWVDKPDGFGAVLSDLLRPELRDTNNSLAALSFGDWYYDFGWIGVAMMVVVVGLGIRWLDSVGGRISFIRSRRDLLLLVVVALLIAGLPTFAWVGSFTYVTRLVQQLIPLLVLALPWASKRTTPEEISTVEPPKRVWPNRMTRVH